MALLLHEKLEIFKLNVGSFPSSDNVYDSLAEAYMKNGAKGLAINNYEKSLKLNPNNTNAKEMQKNWKKQSKISYIATLLFQIIFTKNCIHVHSIIITYWNNIFSNSNYIPLYLIDSFD